MTEQKLATSKASYPAVGNDAKFTCIDSTPTLTYFGDGKGRNELPRLIYAVHGGHHAKYTDELISYEEYTKRRDDGTLPFGQLPTLRLKEDVVIGESCTIARLCAQFTGIYPPTDVVEQAYTDMIVDSWRDTLDGLYAVVFDRKVVDGVYRMVSVERERRQELFDQFVKYQLRPHLKTWEKLYEHNFASQGSDSGLHDSYPYLFKGWLRPGLADLAIFDVIATLQNWFPPGTEDGLLAEFPFLKAMCRAVDEQPEIQQHLAAHPSVNIHGMIFLNEPHEFNVL